MEVEVVMAMAVVAEIDPDKKIIIEDNGVVMGRSSSLLEEGDQGQDLMRDQIDMTDMTGIKDMITIDQNDNPDTTDTDEKVAATPVKKRQSNSNHTHKDSLNKSNKNYEWQSETIKFISKQSFYKYCVECH